MKRENGWAINSIYVVGYVYFNLYCYFPKDICTMERTVRIASCFNRTTTRHKKLPIFSFVPVIV